jgi:hypothetical protein
MLLDEKAKYEMRHRALLEAIRFCGGVVAYSNRLNVNRSRASNWCNQPELNIPYEYVVLTEDVTQVSIERLSPFTDAANEVIRRLRTSDRLLPIIIPFNEILVGDSSYYRCPILERPIIVGTDRGLISGLAQMEAYRNMGMKKARVIVLDLEALILEMRSIKELNNHFLMSELIAIGIRLENLNRNNTKIANILGLPSRDAYCQAKQIYLHGDSELINLLDKRQISIAMAAKKVNSTIDLRKNDFHIMSRKRNLS